MWRQYQQQDLALHQLWLAPHIWLFEVRYDALLADHVQRSPAAIGLTLIIQLGIKHKVWNRWIQEGRVLACLMSKSQLSICCLVFEFITFCAQFCYFFQGQNVPLLLLPTALGVGQYEAHDVMLVMVFCFESCFAEVMQQLFLILLVQLDLFKIRQECDITESKQFQQYIAATVVRGLVLLLGCWMCMCYARSMRWYRVLAFDFWLDQVSCKEIR